jgi:hypothetical protein
LCGILDTIHLYEVRPRKDKRGVDLISDMLPFGRLWYGEPNAISNAQHRSRSHDAVIRVYDDAGNVIETHEHLTRWPGQEQRRQLVDSEPHRPSCAIRSSIKSRSVPQHLSDDRRSLSISSASADSSASTVSGHNAPERLLDVCDLRLDFGIRQPLSPGRAFIKQSPRECFAERRESSLR